MKQVFIRLSAASARQICTGLGVGWRSAATAALWRSSNQRKRKYHKAPGNMGFTGDPAEQLVSDADQVS